MYRNKEGFSTEFAVLFIQYEITRELLEQVQKQYTYIISIFAIFYF